MPPTPAKASASTADHAADRLEVHSATSSCFRCCGRKAPSASPNGSSRRVTMGAVRSSVPSPALLRAKREQRIIGLHRAGRGGGASRRPSWRWSSPFAVKQRLPQHHAALASRRHPALIISKRRRNRASPAGVRWSRGSPSSRCQSRRSLALRRSVPRRPPAGGMNSRPAEDSTFRARPEDHLKERHARGPTGRGGFRGLVSASKTSAQTGMTVGAVGSHPVGPRPNDPFGARAAKRNSGSRHFRVRLFRPRHQYGFTPLKNAQEVLSTGDVRPAVELKLDDVTGPRGRPRGPEAGAPAQPGRGPPWIGAERGSCLGALAHGAHSFHHSPSSASSNLVACPQRALGSSP